MPYEEVFFQRLEEDDPEDYEKLMNKFRLISFKKLNS
jgi:hypothetical protein